MKPTSYKTAGDYWKARKAHDAQRKALGLPARETRAQIERMRCEAIRKHDCAARGCGVVCTFGDW